MSGTPRYLACGLVLLSSLFFFSRPGRTQQVGEAVGVEGTAQRLRAADVRSLYRGDGFVLRDRLRTETRSKLSVLLQTGHKFVLSENVLVSVEEESVSPTQKRTVLTIEQGTVRILTAGRPGTVVVARTATGEAMARDTGFMVSCRPPTTPTPDSCIFVGVYGRIQVESLAFPGRAVDLERQFFTEVRRNQLPTPPQRMPDSQFQDLLDATTVLGTGALEDRLEMAEFGPQRPRPAIFVRPIPDVPLELYEPLPLPPAPPIFSSR